MESKHKAVTLCIAVALITGGYVAKEIVANNNQANVQIELEKQRTEVQIELEKQRTEQIRLLIKKDKSLSSIKSNIENGVKAVVQGAHDADSVTVGGELFNKETISAMVERAKRRPTSAELVEKSYRITNINTAVPASLKFSLCDVETLQEFPATLESASFSAEDKFLLWESAANAIPVQLKVNTTKAGESIKSATIEEILPA